jgi:MFS family permease
LTARDPAQPEHDPYEVLKNRDFLLYLVGRFIASFGQQMVNVAVGWELYERTGSALALGFVGLTQMVPMIALTLPAGHVADNFERKKVILITVGAMAVATLGLGMASWFEAPVGWMYFCLFISGCARTFLWPASSAFLPQLVSRSNFSRAVTWNTGAFHMSSVIGPAAGGALIAWFRSASIVYFINAVAGMICLGLFFLLRVKYKAGPREPMTLKSLGAGFHFVFSNPIVLGIITLDLFAVLLGGAVSLLPVYAKDILHSGPSGLGILQAALPVGSLLCAMFMAHAPPIKKAGRALLVAVAGFGLATVVFGLSRSFILSFAMLFACGLTDNVSVVIRNTLVQLLTPDEKRGRVSAVNSLFIGTSNELGGFESGIVAQYFGPVFSVVSGGIGTVLVVIAVASIWPQIRNYGRLDSGPEPSHAE